MFSSWAAHIPHVKAELGMSDAALGMALFGAPVGSVVAMVLSHWSVPRWGSHRLASITVVGYAAAGVTVGLATSGRLLFLALALWGMFMGALDVAIADEIFEDTPGLIVAVQAREPLCQPGIDCIAGGRTIYFFLDTRRRTEKRDA